MSNETSGWFKNIFSQDKSLGTTGDQTEDLPGIQDTAEDPKDKVRALRKAWPQALEYLKAFGNSTSGTIDTIAAASQENRDHPWVQTFQAMMQLYQSKIEGFSQDEASLSENELVSMLEILNLTDAIEAMLQEMQQVSVSQDYESRLGSLLGTVAGFRVH